MQCHRHLGSCRHTAPVMMECTLTLSQHKLSLLATFVRNENYRSVHMKFMTVQDW